MLFRSTKPATTNVKYNVPGVKASPTQQQTPYGKISYNVPTGLNKPVQANTPIQAPSPEQIRQQKQQAATTAAQQSMVPYSKLPANQTAIQSKNIRQDKQDLAGLQAQVGMLPKKQPKVKPPINYNIPAYQRKGIKGPLGENILNEQSSFTISSYLESFLKRYMGNIDIKIGRAHV